MKKFNIILMSVLTIILSSVLAACTFKKAEASFLENEVVVSLQESLNLDDYLSVKGIEKENIDYRFSNSSLFSIQEKTVTATASGKSFVYATYQNNNLASMQIVVREKFESPNEFSLSKEGVLTWNVVSAFYENETTPTVAQEYLVEGVYEKHSTDSPVDVEETIEISEIVKTNSFTLSGSGLYTLAVTTMASGYFDTSLQSAVQTLYFGYMDTLTAEDISWNNETASVSWSAVAGAKYKVKLDGTILGDFQTTTSKDLKEYFDAAPAGVHNLSVIVYDTEGVKISQESENIEIVKLNTPQVDYSFSTENGGEIEITTASNVEKYQVTLKNIDTLEETKISYDNVSEKIVTDFNELSAGIYETFIIAMNENGNFYKSDVVNFGKIYKIGNPTFEGLGANEENGNTFNAKVSSGAGVVETKLNVLGFPSNVLIDGIAIGQTEKNIALEISNAGSFNLSVKQIPLKEQNTISGENVFVINSNMSALLPIKKLNNFSNITDETISHQYSDNHSVLSFNKIDSASNYELLYFDGTEFVKVENSLYVLEENSATSVQFVLTDKIENLFTAVEENGVNTFKFKIVAKTENDNLTINSSTIKTLTLLSAPISANSGNSTDMTYKWNASNNASSYKLEIFSIDKDTYNANKDNIDINLEGLTSTTITEAEPQHTFENEGYYYVRIYSISSNADAFISSTNYMHEVFYISKKLEAGTVNFGFDENFKNQSGFTESSGYFVKVANASNVDSYELKVNGSTNGIFKISSTTESIYLFAETFAASSTAVEISVVAHSNDETIYLPSEEKKMLVERLPVVAYEDLVVDDLTSKITVNAKTGVSGIKIWQNDGNYVVTENGQAATFDIANLSNFSLTFDLFGSKIQNTIYDDVNGKVYLNSGSSVINFSRLNAPTEFKYYNKDLVFEHSAVSGTKYYVLDLLCTSADLQQIKLSLKFDTMLTVVYESLNVPLVASANYISYTGNTVTIKLGEIVELIKANSTLAGIYNQATKIEFSVYGYQNRNDNQNVTLSSSYGSIYGNTEKTSLGVEKMNSTNLTFAYTETDYTLSWEAVSSNSSIAAETSYQVYMNDAVFGEKVNAGLSYTFSNSTFETSTFYEFYVKAENPYYLESNNSNLVKIYKLRNLPQITLLKDGFFGYEIFASEKDFCKHVDVTVAGATSQNTSGKVEILTSGDYTLKLVGKVVENSGSKIYYIDSQPATWTLTEMETLKPADNTVSFTNNLLSWNTFATGKTFDTLNYIVIFKDEIGGTVQYKTKDTSINLSTNVELFNTISSLQAGNISIGVSAYLEPYNVLSGGTMYYSPKVELLNGQSENNHWLYQSDKAIKKLTTPNVEHVEFAYADLATAQFPDINISFVGNYGATCKFNIYLNDTLLKTETLTETANKYMFTLTKDEYNNVLNVGETLDVKIAALSDSDIPSSSGSVEIVRTVDLKEIKFEANGEKYNQSLQFVFDSNHLNLISGGIVLKIDYQENGGEAKTEYILVDVNSVAEVLSYDLKDFIKTNLLQGGTIKFTAYINSYANDVDKLYYLSAPTVKESQIYNVLKSVSNVSKQSGGFVVDSTLNTETTTYKVAYGGSVFDVSKTNNFYFEFPDNWTNGTYELLLYAEENGFVNSVETQISFVLNRLGKVSSVTMNRDAVDLSAVNLTWNAVSGATKYIVRMYAKDDTEKANVLYSFEGANTTYSLIEIFGENYQTLLDFGKVSALELWNDINVLFEIVAIGNDSSNNSQAYEFYATIKGNKIQTTDISVDEFGKIIFVSETGVDYIYRFVGSDGAVLQNWKNVKANSTSTKLEVDNIEAGILFNVDIIAIGSAINVPASSADNTFILDSINTTTSGNDLTFRLTDEIVDITYDPYLTSNIAIKLSPNSFTKIYAGLDVNSLNKEEVVFFEPTLSIPGETDQINIYSYNLVDFIALFRENGYEIQPSTAQIKIYLWAFKETTDITSSFVVSKGYEFVFKFVEENQYVEIKKMGEITDNPNYTEDYANTFAIFNNTDTAGSLETLGLFVRVTQIEGGEGGQNFTTRRFVTKGDLTNTAYFLDTNLFALNLTKIFENDELVDLTGKFLVEITKLQVEISVGESGDTKYEFVVTDWFKEFGGKVFEFTRIPQVNLLNLSAGNLYWESNGDLASKYYVYFIQDLEGTTLGERYSYFSTTNTYYNASNFLATANLYYIAVQSINEDPYMISSKRVFVTHLVEGVSEPAAVYKNQINSKLVLKNGTLSIDWQTAGDFYTLITSTDTYDKIAEKLGNTIFTSPFTFTLKQLVDNNIFLRIRFTSLKNGAEGIRKSFDINAKYLLTDFYEFGNKNGFDAKSRLGEIYANAGSSTTVKSTIFDFIELIDKGSHGIANYRTLFDECFEAIQTGNYKVDYCLVGNNQTLNSAWYEFANANGENVLYVNNEPTIRAVKTTDENDRSINSYKVIIQKSDIYNYIDGAYNLQTAENYVFKISTTVGYKAFSITKGINKYSLSLLEADEGKTVSVYETDSAGIETANGGYLMFYINYNNGDSLLGTFGSLIEKVTYQMQIYAVGNDFSSSSKSEFFSLVLLGFGESFAINNGVFSWTPQTNRNTTVIYKKNTSASESQVEVDGSMAYARFSLEGLGYGLYDYIKFVNVGEIKNKTIYVDSEIYQIDGVNKLNSPVLTNDKGFITINDASNISMLENSYSDVNLFNYMLYNNVSTADSYISFADDKNAAELLHYEVGTSRVEEHNPDYIYKSTENSASTFYVASVGTTSAINIEQDAAKYYLRRIYCKDATTGESVAKSVAVRSQFASLNAKMLDPVSNVRINDGILHWDEVFGRSEETTLTLPTTGGASVVYKISLAKYKISNTADGETETNVGPEEIYYTAKTSFDFTILAETENLTEKTYLKVLVQAFAMNITDRVPAVRYIELVEGKYAYGNLQYSGTSSYILMGNGTELKHIDRLAPIVDGTLKVENGNLYWNYKTSTNLTVDNFFDTYSFVVVDENGNVIDGQLSAVANTQTDFTIKFVESKGSLSAGTHTLKIYASQGRLNTDVVIKSFAREIEITKLKSISEGDFSLESDSTTETLDLSNYFADGNVNTVQVYVSITKQDGQVEELSPFEFTKTKYKLYILREEADRNNLPNPYPVEYLSGYLIVSIDQTARMTFKVNNSLENNLFSDLSDEIVLQRSTWGENGAITWDEDAQQFNWIYDGYYSLKNQVVADRVHYANVLNSNTNLYNNAELTESANITLDAGTEISVVEVLENSVKISYNENIYFIEKSSYTNQLITVGEETLTTMDSFKIFEKNFENTLIIFDDGNIYQVATNEIVEPVYIVETTYGENPEIVRTYQTTSTTFTPTIVGKVKLKVRIKLGSANIQSQDLEFSRDDGTGNMVDYVDFNLFASGNGTNSSPYLITTNQQFKNISLRMAKDISLNQYVENNRSVTEAEQFYFSIENSLNLSEEGVVDTYLNGVMFKGNFEGIINGNNYTISYISNGVTNLSQGITVAVGNVLGPGNETSTTFEYGTTLFEKLTTNSSISNLSLDVTYASATIPNNSLMAGLTLSNSGRIENVNLVGFKNGFIGYKAPNERIMMVYSGIASINIGGVASIIDCKAQASMEINDSNFSQLIFVSGIVYTNYANIENCVVGQGETGNLSISVVCNKGTDTVQVAGIAITNNSSATLRNCANYYDITVEGTNAQNQIVVYIAGVADLGMGTMSNNTNNGNLTTINIGSGYLYKGDIVAVVR